MACACSTCADRGCGCRCHSFTRPEVAAAAGDRLSNLWDRARDMEARAGLRPYTVSIIRVRASSGARRGDGPTEIVHEWPILPTPKLGDMSGLQEILGPDQMREMGSVQLTGISLQYTEDQLLGRGADGGPIPAGETVFWEVRHLDASGHVTERCRYVASSRPFHDPERAQWTITLTRAPVDRRRDGGMR